MGVEQSAAITKVEVSSTAGTQPYMAPEIKKHFHRGTALRSDPDIVTLQKSDIYQLGLILYEMSHKIKTGMQKTKLFKELAADRKICEQCPLKKDTHIEHKLILRMTESDPENRPSAEEIQKVWLPLLQHEIEESIAPQRPLTIPRGFSRFVTLVALFQRGGDTRGLKSSGVFQ